MYNPFDSGTYTFHKTNSAGFLHASGIYAPHGIGVHKVAEAIRGFNISSSDINGKQSNKPAQISAFSAVLESTPKSMALHTVRPMRAAAGPGQLPTA